MYVQQMKMHWALSSHDRSAEVARNVIIRMAGDFSRSDSVCKIQEQRFNLQSRYMSQVISTNNNYSFLPTTTLSTKAD